MDKKSRKLSQEDIETIIQLRTKGMSMPDIAARFGVSIPTVSRWVNKYAPELLRIQGVTSFTKLSKDDKDRICRLAADGVRQASLGRAFGVSRERIRQIVRKGDSA